ncbi:hypothetical protein TRFO_05093 [Tritrichomonas foetus]|uniref:Uncharacterized protein n=1 Tax=Tritrichomonas foetus TaxID=1144522 RepID=A0A1J4KEZ8_9EUKA|nr:hypothetical protein TRFO_05093 [Tritrichomonas foetus]|eukprot:OHT07957.1 hypothetical protein TRFO_05093 [Tritrichomonas foetus]
MTNIFFMIFAYVGHSTHQQNIASFLLDLQEGKLCQEAFELGLEEIYKRSYGEKPADVFPVADLKPFEFKGRKEEEEKGKEKTEEKKETTPEEVAEEKEKTD